MNTEMTDKELAEYLRKPIEIANDRLIGASEIHSGDNCHLCILARALIVATDELSKRTIRDRDNPRERQIMTIQRYTKLPITIEAVQMPAVTDLDENTINALTEVTDWLTEGGCEWKGDAEPGALTIRINTLEGVMTVRQGDWIIKGVEGEFYPCAPSIFDATYMKSET